MQTLWRYTWRTLLVIVSLLALYVAASYLLSYIPVGPKPTAGPNRVYLHSNGVHLDFVFPIELIPADLLSQLPHAPGTPLLAFGWGDKGFYLDTPTWAELKASTAIKAMFLPSPTAMHVTEHRGVNRKWSYMEISDEQLAQLWEYIRASFKMGEDAGAIDELEGQGYTPQDRFYEAEGNYYLFLTCNTWVNKALKEIGVRTAIWTPLDKGVLRYLPTVENG